jgi:hypothetical protein
MEYRQTLGSLINGLLEEGFHLSQIKEITADYTEPEPGTWGHFTSVAPPWIKFWSHYQGDSTLLST